MKDRRQRDREARAPLAALALAGILLSLAGAAHAQSAQPATAQGVQAGGAQTAPSAAGQGEQPDGDVFGDDCPGNYDFSYSVDYRDPQWQVKIRNIENIHFNSDVEAGIKGQSMAAPGGDIEFLLRYVPNHHRGLYALVKLALRDKTEMPHQTNPYTVRCWLHRGAVYSPKDGKVFLIAGVYLARLGRTQEAIRTLKYAERLLPEDENIHYNLGLLYFDLKDYEHALERAKRAYSLGFPLPGLRRKLEQVGQWRE